jgi:hypothetical protein
VGWHVTQGCFFFCIYYYIFRFGFFGHESVMRGMRLEILRGTYLFWLPGGLVQVHRPMAGVMMMAALT